MGIICSDACCNCVHCCSWCGWNGASHERVNKRELAVNPHWMGSLMKAYPEARLRDCLILGSHDSGTYNISSCMPCASMGRTTRKSIYEQLEIGARYLDIRLGSNGGDPKDVRIYHGPCGAGMFCSSVKSNDIKFTDMNEMSKNDWEHSK